MSENQNCGNQNFSKYDEMTTPELEEILLQDYDAPEGEESDIDTILYVMGVLADRKRKNGHTGKTALEAYESFKLHYMPGPGETEEAEEADEPAMPKRTKPRYLRGLTAAAVIALAVLLGSFAAKALGVDIWETVVRWTQETFHFGNQEQTETPDKEKNLEFSSLQEALQKANIEEKLVPTWIPDGFELTEITVQETPARNVYAAIYQCGDSTLKIIIRNYLNADPQYIEQSDDFIETYTVSNITYHLFSNYDTSRAVWIIDSYECYISGNLTVDQLKLMIDSITKG